MAKVLVTESNLEDIGDAIRDRLQVSTTYLPSEMGDAVRSIPVIDIDTTLTRSGYAADAKVVGDKFDDLIDPVLHLSGKAADAKATGEAVADVGKSVEDVADILGVSLIDGFIGGKYIQTNGDVGSTVAINSPQTSSNFTYAIVNCSVGDKITLNGTGGSAGRLWAFIDSSNAMLSKADANAVASNLILTAPANSAKCVINMNTNSAIGANYVGTSTIEDDREEVESVAKEVERAAAKGTIVSGELVARNGDFVQNSEYERSDYVNVANVSSIFVDNVRLYQISYFDANKVYMGYQEGIAYPATYTPLLNSAYAIFNGAHNLVKNANITLARKTIETRLNEVEYGITLQNILGVTRFPGNLVNPKECVDMAYVNITNGLLTYNQLNYFCTNYLPVTAGRSYRANKGRAYAWYDSAKTFLSGVADTDIQTSITAPENAAYIRFTINKITDVMTDFRLLYFADVEDYDLETTIDGIDIPTLWCYGKKINWIGDSIVDGRDFDEEICEALGLVKENEYGINGSTIALKADGTDARNALCIRYSEMSDDADIVAVSCGTNDFEYAWCPIGTIDDPDDGTSNTTFYGALKTLCKGLINKYPQKVIFFTTPIKRGQPFANGDGGEYTPDGVTITPFSKNKYGKTLMDYADIIKEVCGYYSIPVLDMYRESLLNPHISSQAGMFDSVLTHPNTTGQKIMARRGAGWLTQLGYAIPGLS